MSDERNLELVADGFDRADQKVGEAIAALSTVKELASGGYIYSLDGELELLHQRRQKIRDLATSARLAVKHKLNEKEIRERRNLH